MRKLSLGLSLVGTLIVVTGFAAAQKKTASAGRCIHREGDVGRSQGRCERRDHRPHGRGRKDDHPATGQRMDLPACVIDEEKMCADANSMAFFDAWMEKQAPPDKLGLTYMLAGDDGASNTDPFAKTKTADNHWVVTGPHVMVVGAGAKSLGLASSADADPAGPYMMWAGTPYEHAMIPVAGPNAAAKPAAAKADEMKK